MESFLLSLNIVLPLFCLILLGLFLQKVGLMPSAFVKQLNTVLFHVFYPVIIFYNIYDAPGISVFDPWVILFFLGYIFFTFFFLCFTIPRIEPEPRYRGVMVQGIFRSNFVLFGLPITASVYGEEIGMTAVIIAVIVPVYNILSVVILEVFRGNKPSAKKICTGILTNPLMIGSLIGLFFLITGLKLPYFAEKTVKDLAGVTTPLALVALGASFDFQSATNNRKKLAFCVLGRLVIAPLVFIPLAVLAGLRGIELLAFVSLLSAPTSVSTYNMAQQMDGDSDLAGQIVVFTSILSAFSIFIGVFVVSHFGLL